MSHPAKRGWVLVFAAILLLLAGAPASAHTDLISTSPTDGQTLKAAPAEITLEFGEPLLKGGQRMVATDANGDTSDLDASVNGAVLSAPWPLNSPAGDYKVSYRVVAEDGHPLEGAISFTVKSGNVTASPQASSAPSPAASPASDQQSSGGMNLLLPAVFIIAALIAGFFIWRARGD